MAAQLNETSPDGKPTAVGAYIFAGGFTLGMKQHFHVLCQLEEGPYGVATMRHNQPEIPVYVGPESWPLDDLRNQVIDLIYGNPPCAAWSVAGYTKTRGSDKWRTDPRVACTRKHFSLLGELRPKAWVWESVTQAFTKGREVVDELAAEAAELGYATTILLHDCRWHGVPQKRARFMLVCHRVPVSFRAPNWGPPLTICEALDGVTPKGEEHALNCNSSHPWLKEHLERIPPGTRLRNYWEREVCPPENWVITERGTVKGRPSFGHTRLPADEPSGVVVGYYMIHPTENRFTTINEIQAICGFPQDYDFSSAGRVASSASEIARGVCPPVGSWLGGELAPQLRLEGGTVVPEVRVVDLRQPPGWFGTLEEWDTRTAPKKGARTVKTMASSPKLVPIGLPKDRPPRPKEGTGKMAFLQFLISLDRYTSEQLVEIMRDRFPGAKTSRAVVSDQRAVLREAGHAVPDTKRKPAVELDLS